MNADWHFSVAQIDGVLHVQSHVRDQRSAQFVVEQLERLRQFLTAPPSNPIVPAVWRWSRTFS